MTKEVQQGRKREFSAKLGQAAAYALAHAERTRDCGYVVQLISALPDELRWPLTKWVWAHSPISLKVQDKTIKGAIRKNDDPKFMPFALEAAVETLPEVLGITVHIDFDQLLPETKTGRKKARKLFLDLIEELRAPRVRKNINTRVGRDLASAEHFELHDLFQDCIIRIASGRRELSDSAHELLVAIQQEWKRRASANDFFKWPSTDATPGFTKLGKLLDAPGLGVLSAVGYRVGKTRGQTRPVRHLILDAVFANHLPPINGPGYMREWSGPGTPLRLEKLANTIAACVRNAKRRSQSNSLDAAVGQWSSDLEYLYEVYYVGHFGFGWPRTE